MRFMTMVMNEVMKAAGKDLAVFVKMNMRDGFRGGMEIEGGSCVGFERRICQ